MKNDGEWEKDLTYILHSQLSPVLFYKISLLIQDIVLRGKIFSEQNQPSYKKPFMP